MGSNVILPDSAELQKEPSSNYDTDISSSYSRNTASRSTTIQHILPADRTQYSRKRELYAPSAMHQATMAINVGGRHTINSFREETIETMFLQTIKRTDHRPKDNNGADEPITESGTLTQ